MVVLATPYPFDAIGRYYVDFSQTDDETVVGLLREAHRREEARASPHGV